MRSTPVYMVLETILIGTFCLLGVIICSVGGVLCISTYKSIALGLAEIGEGGKNTRERINARADYEPYSEDGAATGEAAGSELDSIARLAGYASAGAALQDPALIGKVTGMLGGNKTGE